MQLTFPRDSSSALIVFIFVSFATVIGLAFVGFAMHAILERLDIGLLRILRWSARGTDVGTLRRATERYLTLSSVLSRWRTWTGVAYVPARSAPRRLPSPQSSRPQQAFRALVRLILAVPAGALLMLRGTWAWVTYPLGAYLLLGSVWVTIHPDLVIAAGTAAAVWGALSSPYALAILGVLLAAATVSLDHGLTARLRGRNAFRRERAAHAEETLAAMRAGCNDVLDAIDRGLDEIVDATEVVVRTALAHATADEYMLIEGRVEKVAPARARRWGHWDISSPEWQTEEPLLHRGPHGKPDWDPAAALATALRQVQDSGPDKARFWTTHRQAPRPARDLLWEVSSPWGSRPADEQLAVGLLRDPRSNAWAAR